MKVRAHHLTSRKILFHERVVYQRHHCRCALVTYCEAPAVQQPYTARLHKVCTHEAVERIVALVESACGNPSNTTEQIRSLPLRV